MLAVTGAEALYADRGHFGAAPIRLGWFALALPALMLNYLGQACSSCTTRRRHERQHVQPVLLRWSPTGPCGRW